MKSKRIRDKYFLLVSRDTTLLLRRENNGVSNLPAAVYHLAGFVNYMKKKR